VVPLNDKVKDDAESRLGTLAGSSPVTLTKIQSQISMQGHIPTDLVSSPASLTPVAPRSATRMNKPAQNESVLINYDSPNDVVPVVFSNTGKTSGWGAIVRCCCFTFCLSVDLESKIVKAPTTNSNTSSSTSATPSR
jgi:hypothetical protein